MEAIAAFAYMEMLESGFTRVGEFHYLHHDKGGRRFSDPAEMATAIAAAAHAGRDRLDAPARVLRPFRLRRRRARTAAVAVHHRRRRLCAHLSTRAGTWFHHSTTRSSASRPIACGRSRPTSCSAVIGMAAGRSRAYPHRRANEGSGRLRELVRTTPRATGSPIPSKLMIAGVWCMRRTSTTAS